MADSKVCLVPLEPSELRRIAPLLPTATNCLSPKQIPNRFSTAFELTDVQSSPDEDLTMVPLAPTATKVPEPKATSRKDGTEEIPVIEELLKTRVVTIKLEDRMDARMKHCSPQG